MPVVPQRTTTMAMVADLHHPPAACFAVVRRAPPVCGCIAMAPVHSRWIPGECRHLVYHRSRRPVETSHGCLEQSHPPSRRCLTARVPGVLNGCRSGRVQILVSPDTLGECVRREGPTSAIHKGRDPNSSKPAHTGTRAALQRR